jgi:hypothetical protein
MCSVYQFEVGVEIITLSLNTVYRAVVYYSVHGLLNYLAAKLLVHFLTG